MAEGEVLRLTRVFNAPRALVFRAWTEAEQMKRWFCPHDHWGVDVEVDARVGGAYRIAMHDTDTGRDHVARGTFREVRAPERLVFTWRWAEDSPQTLVTVEFRDLGGKTEVTLTHEALPTAESRQKHEHGWNGCLDRLGKVL
jgi:uncharacterized protein YndB with AHSA1/START domain